jgi:hypothetical protein
MPIWVAVLSTSLTTALAKTIYVDDRATGANDGSCWADAYISLQDALDDAVLSDKPLEIRVAQGIYKPDQGQSCTIGDREAAFELINGVTVAGGYAGVSGTDSDVRDVRAYETILSGDLNKDEAVGASSLRDLLAASIRTENSYHVVISNGSDGTAVLDGFTLTGGNANGPASEGLDDQDYRLMCGGGLYCMGGSPRIVNCTFGKNSARYGGGMSNMASNPILENCTFRHNYAERYGGGMDNCQSNPRAVNCAFVDNCCSWGGGISNRTQSKPSVSECTFSENKVDWCGGGMINIDSDSTLIRCTFKGNEARLGGGMRNSRSSPTLTNCLFADNIACSLNGPHGEGPLDGHGGAIFNSHSNPTLTNCTLSGNCAGEYTGGICNIESIALLTNCIVWGNSLPQISGEALVSYSNIEDGWFGESNMNTNPLFADPANDDYHLKSRAGRYDPAARLWIQDGVTSPCIDAGDLRISPGFEPSPNGGIINVGAYGGTIQASKSP